MEYIIITKTKITLQDVEHSIVLFLSKFDAKCSPLAKDDLYGYKIIVSAVNTIIHGFLIVLNVFSQFHFHLFISFFHE